MNARTRFLALPTLAVALTAAGCTTETAPPPAAAGSAAPAPASSPETSVVDTSAVLEVPDQVSKGPTVQVKGVALTAGGWVVVSADNGRNILGTGLVEPGTTPEAIQVSLAEEPTEKLELIARLYADTDKNGLYGAGDRPVSNDDQDGDDDPKAFPGEQAVFDFTGAKVS